MATPSTFHVVLVLVGAVLVHLTLGSCQTFGNLFPYLGSYIKNRTDPLAKVEHLLFIPTFQANLPLGMNLGAWVSQQMPLRLATLLGCALMTLGVISSFYTIQYSIYWFIFSYGFVFGVGTGIAYVAAISAAIEWMPKKLGLVSGIVSAGFGLSASIFAPIQTAIVNPDNFSPNSEGLFDQEVLLDRIPYLFLKSALIYTAMQIVGVLLISEAPKPESDDESIEVEENGNGRLLPTTERTVEMSMMQIVKTPIFQILFVALFFCIFASSMFYSLCKTYAENFIHDDSFLSWAFSFASLVNAIARIVWGKMTDHTSFQKTTSTATLLFACLLATITMAPEFGKVAYLFWITGVFLCIAATNTLFFVGSMKCFGTKNASRNYGVMCLASTLGSSAFSFSSQFLLDTIGYTFMFYIAAIFLLISYILLSCIHFNSLGRSAS